MSNPTSELTATKARKPKAKAKKTKQKKTKPSKPYDGFPLFPHDNGLWCKKIRGRLVYFGVWADSDAALAKYLDERDDLHAGRTPRVKGDGLTVKDLLNRFLTAKKHALDASEITSRTFSQHNKTCKILEAAWGLTRIVSDLAIEDFEKLRADMATTRCAATMKSDIGAVRTILHFAYNNGLIEHPIRTGTAFQAPSRSVLRKEKNEREPKLFTADEIQQMLSAAEPNLKAQIYLGINNALGCHDCGALRYKNLDLDGGWLSFPRPKTGIDRFSALWPETISALHESDRFRRQPKDPAHKDFVFMNFHGRPCADLETRNTSIGMAFIRLIHKLDLHKERRGFYSLRHTFATVSGNARDQVATNVAMGHAGDAMPENYRHGIDDDRLVRVAEHVRHWLFGDGDAEVAPAAWGFQLKAPAPKLLALPSTN